MFEIAGKKTYEEAEAACADLIEGGRLAILDNRDVMDEIGRIMINGFFEWYYTDYLFGDSDLYSYRSYWFGLKPTAEGIKLRNLETSAISFSF